MWYRNRLAPKRDVALRGGVLKVVPSLAIKDDSLM